MSVRCVRGLRLTVLDARIPIRSTTFSYSQLPIHAARHVRLSILKRRISSVNNVIQVLETGTQSLQRLHVSLAAMLHVPLVLATPTPNVLPVPPPTISSPIPPNAPPLVHMVMKSAPLLMSVCSPNTATLHVKHASSKPTWPNAEPVPTHSLPPSLLPPSPPTPMLYVPLFYQTLTTPRLTSSHQSMLHLLSPKGISNQYSSMEPTEPLPTPLYHRLSSKVEIF